jgi:catechol 2,3-dioxygenase-like lactoylglutathione lyase family enzyme
MKIRGTDFIMFPVSDLAAAARFYREILGLPQEIYSDQYQWAEFNCGNVTLSLKGGSPPSELNAGTRLALAVDDIHAAYAELQACGARLAGPPQDHGCCWHLEVQDPDGHAVLLHRRADGTCGQPRSAAEGESE